MKFKRKYTFLFFPFSLLVPFFIVWANVTMDYSMNGFVSPDSSSFSPLNTAVLFGTTRLVADVGLNTIFYTRVIFPDHKGYRTFDSMVRVQKILGQTTFIEVSQELHNRWPVCTENNDGKEAFGNDAEKVKSYTSIKTGVQEFFSGAKVFMDFMLNCKLQLLGEKIQIG